MKNEPSSFSPGFAARVLKRLRPQPVGRITSNGVLALTVAFVLLLGVGITCAFSGTTGGFDTEQTAQALAAAAVTESVEDTDKVPAYSLSIDGHYICASAEENIENALDTLLSAKIASYPISGATGGQILNEIKIEPGLFDRDEIADMDKLLSLLGAEDKYSYTFKLSSLSGEPVEAELSVIVFARESAEYVIERGKTYLDTDRKTAGYEKQLDSGSDGLGIAYYDTAYIDGEKAESSFISSEIISEPVNEVYERGIGAESKSVSSLRILEMPYEGRISSYFGWRSMGYHEGLDIIGPAGHECYGDNALSAEDGVVTYAGSAGNAYGKYVMVDHGDGLVTLYAHLSSISVSVGDYVSAGDSVGKIGTTGRVTGPHLHFEVRLDGVKMDPLLFLKFD